MYLRKMSCGQGEKSIERYKRNTAAIDEYKRRRV